MSDVIMVIVFIAVPLVVGMLSARAAGNSKKKYEAFRQPPLSPPGFLFPIVWTILYVLMGISSYLAYKGAALAGASVAVILTPYIIQLALNFTWSIIFFRNRGYLAGSVWLLALIGSIIWMMAAFYPYSPLATLLQIPYLCWCLFATFLSFGVAKLNKKHT